MSDVSKDSMFHKTPPHMSVVLYGSETLTMMRHIIRRLILSTCRQKHMITAPQLQ